MVLQTFGFWNSSKTAISKVKKIQLVKDHASHLVLRSCQRPMNPKMNQMVISCVCFPPSGMYRYLTIHLFRLPCHDLEICVFFFFADEEYAWMKNEELVFDLQNPVNVKLLQTHLFIFSGVSILSRSAIARKNLQITRNFMYIKFKVQNPVKATYFGNLKNKQSVWMLFFFWSLDKAWNLGFSTTWVRWKHFDRKSEVRYPKQRHILMFESTWAKIWWNRISFGVLKPEIKILERKWNIIYNITWFTKALKEQMGPAR